MFAIYIRCNDALIKEARTYMYAVLLVCGHGPSTSYVLDSTVRGLAQRRAERHCRDEK